MAKKADHQDDSTECVTATEDEEINHYMDVVDKATAKRKAETQEHQ
jgi:hypothetical protein